MEYIEYSSLQPEVWEYRLEVIDAGMSDEYLVYFNTHRFPQFTCPDELGPIAVVQQAGVERHEGVASGEQAVSRGEEEGGKDEEGGRDNDILDDGDDGGDDGREEGRAVRKRFNILASAQIV